MTSANSWETAELSEVVEVLGKKASDVIVLGFNLGVLKELLVFRLKSEIPPSAILWV